MREIEIYENSREFKASKTIEIEMTKCRFPKIVEFEKENDYVKFIKSIEKLVRSSIEYRDYISMTKDTLDMNRCALYKNLDRSILPISIEIHHSPFTLFEITAVASNAYFNHYGYYNPRAIANAVLKLHYKGYVGLIPLSKTVHKLVHRGDIFLPVNVPFGDWELFEHLYQKYFTDDQRASISYKKKLSYRIETGDIPWSCPVLDEQLTFLDLKGVDLNLEPMDLAIKSKIEVKDELEESA